MMTNLSALLTLATKTAIRSFRKNRLYGGLNILGLALAFATIILVFAYLNHETGYESFHEHKDQIYRTTYQFQSENGFEVHWARVPFDFVNAMPEDIPEVKQLIRFQNQEQKYIRIGEQRFKPGHAYVTDAQVFEVFTFPLLRGNAKTALSQPNAVVITQSLAQTYFGSIEVLGQELVVTGDFTPEEEVYSITGVMEDLPGNTHLPVDMLFSFDNEEDRTGWAYIYILLEDGADAASVSAKLPDFVDSYRDADAVGEVVLHLQSLGDIHLTSALAREIQPNGHLLYIKIFFWVGLFIWIIALVNFTNLSTALAMYRGKEVGVRKVLGAKKNQLILSTLVESVCYSMVAMIVGRALAMVCFPFFSQLTGITETPSLWTITWLMIGLALISGVLAGLFPAIMLSSVRILRVLKLGKHWTLPTRGHRINFRRIMLTGQFCATIILIASAFAAYRQFQYINTKNLGLASEQIIAIADVPDHVTAEYPVFKNRLEQIPGVLEVSACMQVPSEEIRDSGPVRLEGAGEEETAPMMDMQIVDPHFVEMMQLELLAGTDFTRQTTLRPVPQFGEDLSAADYLASADRQYLINETAMKQLGWHDPEEAIGQRINWSIGPFQLAYGPVAGVVKDYHQETLRNTVDPTVMVVEPIWLRTFLVKVATDNLASTMSAIRDAWNVQFPLALEYHFLDDLFDQLYRQDRVQLQLLSMLALLAVLISFVGLVSLVAFALRTRAKEIAIRRVIGASLTNLTTLLGKEYFWILGIAAAVGVPISVKWVLAWMSNFAYQQPLSAWTYIGTLVLILVLLLAIITLQTFLATVQSPVHALREE